MPPCTPTARGSRRDERLIAARSLLSVAVCLPAAPLLLCNGPGVCSPTPGMPRRRSDPPRRSGRADRRPDGTGDRPTRSAGCDPCRSWGLTGGRGDPGTAAGRAAHRSSGQRTRPFGGARERGGSAAGAGPCGRVRPGRAGYAGRVMR